MTSMTTEKSLRSRKGAALPLVLGLVLSLAACSGSAPGDAMADVMGAANPNGGNDMTSGENYTEIKENDFILTTEEACSYFSIDANTASYPNIRSRIQNGYTVPKDAVRVEEMLNYFNYDYATPEDGAILSLTSSVFDTPYNESTKLLTIGLAAQEVSFAESKNNLVFLLDTSGSMYDNNKLPLVQQAFMLLAEHLNPEDRVSIVTYAGNDHIALDGAFGNEKQKIVAVIEDLAAGGSTAGSKGIETAYKLASKYFIEGGNNRVILMTDGDFNVGLTGTKELEDFISEKRDSGVYFSVFGVGRGNLQSDKMEALALNGNGTYSYLDSVKEAKRALVEEIGGTMLTVAKDVKASVTFNAEYVESYRLIGYENKLLTREEFEDDSTDAGELGSGHTVTVAYEIKLTDRALAEGDHLAEVTIKYKPTENSAVGEAETAADGTASSELKLNIGTEAYHAAMTENDAFVASVIEFALILRDSAYKQDADLNALITRLDDLALEDEFKQEFRDLVKLYRNNAENT